MTNGPVSRWQRLTEKVVAATRIFELTSVLFRHPVRKVEGDFVVIKAPDWVNVVALTQDRQMVLVKQFRFGIDDISLEIPGGIMELGEDPLRTALRELEEETGYRGTGARLLGVVHPNPAIQSNRCHLVFVENVVKSSQLNWDQHEELEVLTAPVDRVYEWAAAGKITHSLVLDALLLFMPVWKELQVESRRSV
ncbi:MAG TPA: NUDIX hydrolase [Opitutaceae bacterium]|nr:NUDIX hydrolase [Opitutaceae bacterium]